MALSANTFSTLFMRQMVVPTLSEAASMNATGVVGIVPVPTAQSNSVTGPPFTMGHGPVVASAAPTLDHQWAIGHGPAMSSPTAASLWTTGHGPVVSGPTFTMSLAQVVTKAAPPPASTLATVVRRTSATLSTPGVTRRPLVPQNFLNDPLGLGCHDHDDDWIYFTLIKSDDSIAVSFQGKRVLNFVSKEWTLTYPDKIRKALFNDPSSYPTCPEGHCRSALISGTDLRLSLVKSPQAFRSGGSMDSCGYVDDVHTIEQNLVTRAKFGYLDNGVTVDDAIIPFVEQQVLTTYPALEIGLILGFTVGIFVTFPLLVLFLICLYHCVNHCMIIVVEKVRECGQVVAAGVDIGFDRLRRTGEKNESLHPRVRVPDPIPHQDRGYAVAPPPAYSFV